MAFFNTILLLKLNIRTHHVNSFPPFFNYISEGFLCLISLVGAALQRCLHRPPSPHLLFFLSVISVSPTPSTGVESRTSHTLSYILSFVFRTGSHKVNLASLRFALYPRLALTSCSPFFRLPSSCQPVCLLLVLKDLFPLSNKLLLRTSTVLLSLASVARGTPLILSHGPASYCSSLHTKGVLGKLTLTLSSCWQPVLPPVSPCSAILCLVCPLPSEPCAVTLHNFLQPGKRNPREESYEAGSLTTYLRVLFTHWKKKSPRLAFKSEPAEISGTSPFLAYFSSFLFFERLVFKLLFMHRRCLTTLWTSFKFSFSLLYACMCTSCMPVGSPGTGIGTPCGW